MAERAQEESLPQMVALQATLRENYRDKAQTQLLPQSGSERRVFRLKKDYGSDILVDASAMGAQARGYLQKLQNLSGFLTQAGLRVPRIKHLDFANHCVIIEDLGKDSYARCLRTRTMKNCLGLFENALQSLLRLSHSKLSHSNLARNNLACNEQLQGQLAQGQADVVETHTLLPAFSEQRFVEQVSSFFDYFLLSPNNAQHTNSNEALPTICRSSWQKIWQKLYREAQFQNEEITVALGDVHIENLFAVAEAEHGTCAFIDFQDAHLAPRCYDVVSLLEDGLWDMPDFWRKQLWASYCDEARLQQRERHSAARHYELCALHRDIRMIGILYRLLYKRGRKRYGEWLGRVARNCEKRMAQNSKFTDLRKFIEGAAVNWQLRIEEESKNAPQIVTTKEAAGVFTC